MPFNPGTRHKVFIADCQAHAPMLVYPVFQLLLFEFIPNHYASARPHCEARTHAIARRPRPAAALRARPGSGLACSFASVHPR
eukprot:463269-Pleurochrysis_carterae.AAC.1